MASFKSIAVAAVALAARAVADDHIQKITAYADPSKSPQFYFEPSSLTAAIGDILEFRFMPANHSVAQGTFDSPCSPMQGGFWSGYAPTESGEYPEVWQVKVESEDPMVFYCTQGAHCANGMYGVVNPSSDQSYESYGSTVSGASTVAPSTIGGGEWVAPGTEAGHDGDKTDDKKDDGSGAISVKGSFAGVAAALGLAFMMA